MFVITLLLFFSRFARNLSARHPVRVTLCLQRNLSNLFSWSLLRREIFQIFQIFQIFFFICLICWICQISASSEALLCLYYKSVAEAVRAGFRRAPVWDGFYCSFTVQPLGMPLEPSGQVEPLALVNVPVVATPSSHPEVQPSALMSVARQVTEFRLVQPANML